MSDLFDIVEESEDAYGAAGESCSEIFRGHCAKYRISARSSIDDGGSGALFFYRLGAFFTPQGAPSPISSRRLVHT